MFKAVKATTVKEYFDMLPPERREPMNFLQDFIQKKFPNLKPNFLYNMPGYGTFKCRNYKKEIIDWPTVSLASQKNYISLYICGVEDGKYIVEKYKDILGKVDAGKSCIRIKKVEDLNLEGLEKVIKIAEAKPGLPGMETTS